MRLKELESQDPCCEATANIPELSLLDKVRAEKAKVSKDLRQRIRELDHAESMLVESEAETILERVTAVLYK